MIRPIFKKGKNMKTLNDIFYDFNSKVDEALHLEELLENAKQESELLKKEILNEPNLHEILTTVGIIHNKKLYKKVSAPYKENRTYDEKAYILDVQDYIEPVYSCQLDAKLGDNNE